MTDQEVAQQVEQWNNNMNIFEIYDELKDRFSSGDQEKLLNRAYEDWNHPPMLKLIEELASHLGAYLETKEPSINLKLEDAILESNLDL